MILVCGKTEGYKLLDSGEGEKLERFGEIVLSRPDPEALWRKHNPELWKTADSTYVRAGNNGSWKGGKKLPEAWTIPFGGFNFEIRATSFKHTGLFPEQISNWEWIAETIKNAKRPVDRPVRVLNLFAYTGGASLAAASVGAEVVHVDASKVSNTWAKKNETLSNLINAKIRYITDDAMEFVAREVRRGNTYDAIIMDPPQFGHGPKGELWKIEESFLSLVDNCRKILSDDPLFVLVSGYAAGYSRLVYEENVREIARGFEGTVESGELVIEESSTQGAEKMTRMLPCGIVARWKKK